MKLPKPTLNEVAMQVGKPYLFPIGILQVLIFASVLLMPVTLFWVSFVTFLKLMGTAIVALIGVTAIFHIALNATKEAVIKEYKRRQQQNETDSH